MPLVTPSEPSNRRSYAFLVPTRRPYTGFHHSSILAGLAATSEGVSRCVAAMAARGICGRDACRVGGFRFSSCHARSPLPHGPHGAASSSHDNSGSTDSVGRSGNRTAPGVPAEHLRTFPSALSKAICPRVHPSCVLLAGLHRGGDRLAYSRCVRSRDAIGTRPCGRAVLLPRCRNPVLVACHPAMARDREMAVMVDPCLSLPGRFAMRRSFGLSLSV